MKIDWENMPKIRNGQTWKHKFTGKLVMVAGSNGGGRQKMVYLSSLSGSKNHHTTIKDVYLHFDLIS